MALFRHPNGTYYIITSHLTGWGPNPLMLFRAAGATLDDPQWVDMGNPTGDATSFNTQPTYVITAVDAKGDSYFIYLADNWIHGGPQGLTDAAYVWLPLKFGADIVTLDKTLAWSMKAPFTPVPTPPPTPAPPCTGVAGSTMSLQPCTNTGSGMEWTMTPAQSNPANVVVKTGGDLCMMVHNEKLLDVQVSFSFSVTRLLFNNPSSIKLTNSYY